MTDLPLPSPQTVRAARAHLARRYAVGVQKLLWEEHDQPLPDAQAVGRVTAAVERARETDEPPPAAIDLGAALVVLAAVRLDVDRLEVELVGAARQAGMEWKTIADVLGLPEAGAAERRFEKLRPRLDAPVDQVERRPSSDATPRPRAS
jgi:hypothetical protein